jgi:hypothetical protein
MDQSNRYADLSLREEDLIKGGRHILVAYKMKPKAGYDYLQAQPTSPPSRPPVPMSKCAPPTSLPAASMPWST